MVMSRFCHRFCPLGFSQDWVDITTHKNDITSFVQCHLCLNCKHFQRHIDKTKDIWYDYVQQNKMIGVIAIANLVFYDGWTKTLKAIEAINGREFVNECFRQICIYGTTGEFDTNDQTIIDFVSGMCAAQISKSQKRYEACKGNGQQGGRPSKYSTEEIVRLHDAGLSNQDIADNLGCSVKTVQRALADIDDEI